MKGKDMKKLQIALDVFTTKEALEILEEVADYVDYVEVGTPLCIAEGASATREVKKHFPDKIVFSDIKVMDGGSDCPRSVIDAGCDMFSVLATTDDNTMREAIKLGHDNEVMVLADFCNVSNMSKRALELDSFRADYLCCHVGYGRQESGANPVEELCQLEVANTPKAIAGGIKLSTFQQALESSAEDIIVGGGIVRADNRIAVAKEMRKMMDAANGKEA